MWGQSFHCFVDLSSTPQAKGFPCLIFAMERFQSSLNYIWSKLTEKRTLLGAVFIAAALSYIALFASANSGQLSVHFMDVGQGDAIFIEMPNGRQILIDGGGSSKIVEKLNKYMPFWDRSIDIVIATHADSDHIGGLPAVLAHYDVDVILWNGAPANTKIFQEWAEAALNEGAEIIVGEHGMRFNLSDYAFFEILHPNFNSSGSPLRPFGASEWQADPVRLKQNELSLVVRFVYGDDSFLFTGDIERQGEYAIISSGANIISDVLKVAHHGSKTSSSELFLESVHSKIAVMQVGRNNSHGHPHESILQRFNKYGIDIRRTDLMGDITIISNGNSY